MDYMVRGIGYSSVCGSLPLKIDRGISAPESILMLLFAKYVSCLAAYKTLLYSRAKTIMVLLQYTTAASLTTTVISMGSH